MEGIDREKRERLILASLMERRVSAEEESRQASADSTARDERSANARSRTAGRVGTARRADTVASPPHSTRRSHA